jgi:hypothetical protein
MEKKNHVRNENEEFDKDDQNSHYYKLQIRYYLLEDQNLIEEFDKKKINQETYIHPY